MIIHTQRGQLLRELHDDIIKRSEQLTGTVADVKVCLNRFMAALYEFGDEQAIITPEMAFDFGGAVDSCGSALNRAIALEEKIWEL